MMNIQEGNILIANWLGWDIHLSIYPLEEHRTLIKSEYWKHNTSCGHNDLLFHSDLNWQIVCLQKIMKDNELKSLRQVFSLLEDIQSEIKDEAVDISTELEVFNSIVSYINKQ